MVSEKTPHSEVREASGPTYLAEAFGLGMLLETEGREVDTGSEDSGLGQDTDAPHSIDLHFHIRVAVGVAQVGQVRAPGRVLGVALHDDGVFVERVGEGQRRLGFLPRVQIVGLLATEPVGKRSPDICVGVLVVYLVTWQTGDFQGSKGNSRSGGWLCYVGAGLLGTITSLLCRIRSSRIVKGAVSTSTSLQ